MTPDGHTPIYRLLFDAAPLTAGEIEAAVGLSRATTAQRLDDLIAAGLVVEHGRAASRGGRRARTYAIDARHRCVIGIDIGESMARLCLYDLAFAVVGEKLVPLDLDGPPDGTLDLLAAGARDLAAAAPAPVAAAGVGLPAPVDVRRGRVAAPSVMAAWEGRDLRADLGARLGLPVIVENDVNAMCMAEWRHHWADARDMIYIKAGTGIGCGIINDTRLLRGSIGVSGDIGHISHTTAPGRLCRCGKRGCVEAHAAGWALARDLREEGLDCTDARGVMECYFRGLPEARRALGDASRVIGAVSADLVAILNPELLVISGQLARAGEAMLAGIRERVYQRCLPLATTGLRIETGRGDERIGATGAAMLAMDALIGRDACSGLVRHEAPRGDAKAV